MTLEQRLKDEAKQRRAALYGRPEPARKLEPMRTRGEVFQMREEIEALKAEIRRLHSEIERKDASIRLLTPRPRLSLSQIRSINQTDRTAAAHIELGGRIRDVVLEYYGIPYELFVSERQPQDVALARHIFFYVARNHTGLSLRRIGRLAGKDDHSTTMNGYSRILAALHRQDPEITTDVAAISRSIEAL